MKKFLFTLVFVLIMAVSASADIKLPDGSVEGLPQNLIVLDENGNHPVDGEFYITIDNMEPNEVYTKDITLMNARSDAVYSIYMWAQPIGTAGNIDLLNNTNCKLYLDNKLIYDGLVNGDGSPNMQTDGIDLGGTFESGEARNLHADFVWNWSKEAQNLQNNNDGTAEYYGEVSFKWIFYAAITESSNHSGGGGGGGGRTPGGTDDTDDDDTDKSASGGGADSTIDNESETTDSSTHKNPHSPDDDTDYEDNTELTSESEIEPDTEDDVLDKVIDSLPLPENVKTGYKSQIKLYMTLAAVCFCAAVAVLIIILKQKTKLNRLKKDK